MISRNLTRTKKTGISGWLMLLAVSLFLTSAGYTQAPGKYLTHQELTSGIRGLTAAHQDLSSVESIGKTAQGRDIWMMTLARKGGSPVDERPGLLIAANFEGDHLIGSSLSLGIARDLLESYGSDEAVKKALENNVFYILPRLNADGAELQFGPVVGSVKGNSAPFDADNDGRLDEDGPDDLNKDGKITVMRVKDANGLYCIDPEESSLLKKADPAKGERGIYSVYPEGLDADQDGFINEDPAGGTDLNRNFMHAYPYFGENAGKHMVSEPETRALIEWILKHKNIAIALAFGESDNLIVPPTSRGQMTSDRPLDLVRFAQASLANASKVGMVTDGFRGGRGRFMMGDMYSGMFGQSGQQASTGRAQRPSPTPATTVNNSDLEYFNLVSEKYKELTGIKVQPVLRNPEGAFFQYAYFQLGIPAFSTPGWGLVLPADSSRRPGRGTMGQRPGGGETPSAGGGSFAATQSGSRAMGGGGAQAAGQQESASQAPGIDAQYLKHLNTNKIDGFVKWQTVQHPEFGEVEVGGFTPMEINNPPVDKIADLTSGHARFALYLTSLFADIAIAKTEVVNEGGGLYRIRAEVANEGFLPTALRQGVQARSVKPTMVQLGVDPEQILSGNNKTNFFQALEGSGKRQKYEWLIKGKSGEQIDLRVVSQKGGTELSKITLK